MLNKLIIINIKYLNKINYKNILIPYSNDANPKREDLVVKNAARLGYTKFHSSAIDGRELKNYFDIKFNKILL